MKNRFGRFGAGDPQGVVAESHFGWIVLSPVEEDVKPMVAFDGEAVALQLAAVYVEVAAAAWVVLVVVPPADDLVAVVAAVAVAAIFASCSQGVMRQQPLQPPLHSLHRSSQGELLLTSLGEHC